MKALVVVFLVATAHADVPSPAQGDGPPSAEPAAPPSVQRLTADAQLAAQRGQCDALASIAARVRALDPEFFITTFSTDPIIAGCVPAPAPAPVGATSPPGADLEPAPVRAPAPQAEPEELDEDVSPSTALALSFGITAGGYALAIVGGSANSDTVGSLGALLAIIGPTTGHIYAGNTWNTGLKVRLGGLGIATVGFLTFITSGCLFGEGSCNDSAATAGMFLFVGGGITHFAGTIYEVFTAGRSARETNEARRGHLQLGVAPIVTPRGTAPGLTLSGHF